MKKYILLVACLLPLAAIAQKEASPPVANQLKVGSPTPAFSHEDLNGRPISLSDYKGQYVLIDFWASWCRPCRAESPNLMKAYKQLYNKGLEIISVSVDADMEAWRKAIAIDGLPWTHICDKGMKEGIAESYGVNSIPRNFLIGPDGNLIGFNYLGDNVDKVLAEIMNVQLTQ